VAVVDLADVAGKADEADVALGVYKGDKKGENGRKGMRVNVAYRRLPVVSDHMGSNNNLGGTCWAFAVIAIDVDYVG
jgi:hypothetical protein